jgi:hypothetical protein
LAEKLKHDVFDCAYLAFALQETAKGIVTTDTDFEQICRQVGLEYINPVPKNVLKGFAEQDTDEDVTQGRTRMSVTSRNETICRVASLFSSKLAE